jgi:hypothetical protein
MVRAGKLAAQPDGRVIVAGSLGSTPAMWRLDSSGVLDETFGEGGYVLYPFEAPGDAPAHPDSVVSIVLDLGVAKLTSDGSFDVSFSWDGRAFDTTPERQPVITGGVDGSGRVVAVRDVGRVCRQGLPSARVARTAARVRVWRSAPRTYPYG